MSIILDAYDNARRWHKGQNLTRILSVENTSTELTKTHTEDTLGNYWRISTSKDMIN